MEQNVNLAKGAKPWQDDTIPYQRIFCGAFVDLCFVFFFKGLASFKTMTTTAAVASLAVKAG